jgi:hypothetical protein
MRVVPRRWIRRKQSGPGGGAGEVRGAEEVEEVKREGPRRWNT